jgi:hypothetical protein
LVWEWYKGIAKNHRLKLDLLDDALSRLLFWLPHSNSDVGGGHPEHVHGESWDTAWREVGYGILSLHRLSMDLALEDDDDEDCSKEDEDEGMQTAAAAAASRRRLRRNHYGSSIRTKDPPTIAATSLRICLTVLHSIMPSLISLAMLRARNNNHHYRRSPFHNSNALNRSATVAAEASRVRLMLEKAKFLLRLSLLVAYWRQQQQQQRQQETASADYGIMLDGGLYHSHQPQETIGFPWDRARDLQRRRNYVGERTGWKAHERHNTNNTGNTVLEQRGGFSEKARQILFGGNVSNRNASTAVAELLYAVRPLLWAWFESRYHGSLATRRRRQGEGIHHERLPTPQGATSAYNIREGSWTKTGQQSRGIPSMLPNAGATSPYNVREGRKGKPSLLGGWLLCLAADVLSIRLLVGRQHQQKHDSGHNHGLRSNPFEDSEVRRRKLRLLLHFLRAPVWSSHTLPALEGVSKNVLSKLPVVGNLLETVLWDWILYYQHPFVSEEG